MKNVGPQKFTRQEGVKTKHMNLNSEGPRILECEPNPFQFFEIGTGPIKHITSINDPLIK